MDCRGSPLPPGTAEPHVPPSPQILTSVSFAPPLPLGTKQARPPSLRQRGDAAGTQPRALLPRAVALLLAPSLPDGSAELLSLKNVLLISQHHLTKTAAALLSQRRARPWGRPGGMGLVSAGGMQHLLEGLMVF